MRVLAALATVLVTSVLAGCGGGAPESAGDHGSPPVGHGSGIVGLVRLGPRCPVETTNDPCGDQPVAGSKVTVARQRPTGSGPGGSAVTSRTTDVHGSYRIALRPGTYVVTADAGTSCSRTSVRVVSGSFTRLDISCDTGIR